MKKKILITGGAGFVGSHLCQKLVDLGHEVICLDNFYTGRKSNIDHLLARPNFSLVNHDIIDTLPDLHVDEIYNLACPASPPHYQRDPIYTLKTSVWGILNVLELARKNNAKILQASTSEVYGDPDIHPQPESYWGHVNPNGIRSCYDEGKRCAETLMFDYWRKYGTAIRVIRIFNTYGPNMDPGDGRVVSNFIVQALRGENITIYGTGNQTRSFQYVDDLIAGMVSMMENDKDFVGPVNLGNTGEFTIKELAEKVIALIPETTSKVVFKDIPQDDPRQRQPDISLAKEKLNWSPAIPLADGLVKTISYFRTIVDLDVTGTTSRQTEKVENRVA